MKKLMIFAILIAMTLTTSLKSFAIGDNENNPSFPLSVYASKDGKYNLIYALQDSKVVKVSIFNEKGQQIHSDFVKNTSGFKLSYDLNDLPEGTYQVMVKDNKKKYSTSINHKKVTEFFKTFIKSENGDGKYNLKVLRQTMKPVSVTIYDKNNKVLFTEYIDVDFNFERVYDLSHNSVNAKSITVKSGNNKVDHFIN